MRAKRVSKFLLALLLLLAVPAYPAEQITTFVHVAANCTASSSSVLTRGGLKLMLIQNDSDTDMYLTFEGTDAALHTGFLLKSGTSFGFDVSVPNPSAVKCIHGSTGNKVILFTLG